MPLIDYPDELWQIWKSIWQTSEWHGTTNISGTYGHISYISIHKLITLTISETSIFWAGF